MRPSQWFQLSGAAARQAAAGGGYYAKLSGINALPVNMLLQISEDLSPGIFQFRTHPLFKKQDGMDAVRRILCAYLQRNPAGVWAVAEVEAAASAAARRYLHDVPAAVVLFLGFPQRKQCLNSSS
jgi:hypothetical protein